MYSEKPKSMIDLSKVKVVLGDTNKCKDTDSMLKASQYDIERVILHYAYDGNIVDNDIALVKLKKKIEMKMNILSVRMAESGIVSTKVYSGSGNLYSNTVSLI